jgi:hypothetical protein
MAMSDEPNLLPRKVLAESIVADDGAFLWLCIAKNASRSLLQLLKPRGKRLIELAGDRHFRDWLAQADLPAWSFAAVRHPEARLVSAWMNKLQRPWPTEAQARLMRSNPGLVEGMSLDAFIDWLGEHVPDRGVDPHWRPQHHFICDRHGVRRASFVARCERLGEDLRSVADHLGPLEDLPWLNATGGEGGVPNLTTRQRTAIRDIYAADFELFGYD